MSSYFKKNCGISFIFIRIIFLYYLSLFELFRLAWLKIPRSDIRIIKLTKYSICDSLATLYFTQTVSLRRRCRGKGKFCSGKHTKNHLNRKCKDNESTIQYARPLCLPRIAELYSPADHEKPFSGYKIPSTGEIVFLIDILYKATFGIIIMKFARCDTFVWTDTIQRFI